MFPVTPVPDVRLVTFAGNLLTEAEMPLQDTSASGSGPSLVRESYRHF